jgi:hypothetical protein
VDYRPEESGFRRLGVSPSGKNATLGGAGGTAERGRKPTQSADRYSFEATLLKVDVRLVPTNWNALIAATAIKAAIRPYSIAVAPSSFFHNFISVTNI